MSSLTAKLVAAGILFLMTIPSGVILSHSGRPLNIILVTLHKLVAIAAAVLIALAVRQLLQAGDARVFIEIGLMVVIAVLFLALIATGAFLTREVPLPAFILKVHQAAPALAFVFSAITLYLMTRGNA